MLVLILSGRVSVLPSLLCRPGGENDTDEPEAEGVSGSFASPFEPLSDLNRAKGELSSGSAEGTRIGLGVNMSSLEAERGRAVGKMAGDVFARASDGRSDATGDVGGEGEGPCTCTWGTASGVGISIGADDAVLPSPCLAGNVYRAGAGAGIVASDDASF